MENYVTIIILIALIIIIINIGQINKQYKNKSNNIEGLEVSATNPLDKEALQNIASVYNKENLIVTNTTITGNLLGKAGGNHLRIASPTYFNGGSGNKGGTHFPWVDGNNYISGNLTKVRGTLATDGAVNIAGNTSIGGELNIDGTIKAGGRMHITGTELLYILNKNGVIISKAWGGNGNLSVQGNITGPTVNAMNARLTALEKNTIKENDQIGLLSNNSYWLNACGTNASSWPTCKSGYTATWAGPNAGGVWSKMLVKRK